MSKKRCRVILYGDSLVLQGVRTGLETCPDFELILLGTSLEKPLEAIRASSPAVFIFDVETIPPDFQLSLLRHPDLLLIGLDSETHQCLVWSGRQKTAVDATELIRIIRLESFNPESP